jgi:hypothetical protein
MNVSVGEPSQASVTVGVVNDGVAGHWIVLGAGIPESTGAVVSWIVIVWLALLLLPQWSAAVHVRVIV